MSNLILATPEKCVIVISSDDESFEIPMSIALMSNLIKTTVQEDSSDETQTVPLPNVNAVTLTKVIEFCKLYKENPMLEIEKPLTNENLREVVQPIYADYIEIDQNDVFNLIVAANYLDIVPLIDLCFAKIASFIKGKTVEQIREKLNIVNDLTPEEEAEIREENSWADKSF